MGFLGRVRLRIYRYGLIWQGACLGCYCFVLPWAGCCICSGAFWERCERGEVQALPRLRAACGLQRKLQNCEPLSSREETYKPSCWHCAPWRRNTSQILYVPDPLSTEVDRYINIIGPRARHSSDPGDKPRSVRHWRGSRALSVLTALARDLRMKLRGSLYDSMAHKLPMDLYTMASLSTCCQLCWEWRNVHLPSGRPVVRPAATSHRGELAPSSSGPC